MSQAVETSNFSGYMGLGGYSKVSAIWHVPEVTTNGTMVQWVGLQNGSATALVQCGTSSVYSNGKATYQAWYEDWPSGPVAVFDVTPGEWIEAGVTVTGSTATMAIEATSHAWVIKTVSFPYQVDTCEWMIEIPAGDAEPHFGSAEFTSIGHVGYTNDSYLYYTPSMSASLSGTTIEIYQS